MLEVIDDKYMYLTYYVRLVGIERSDCKYNNNIYLLQLGCNPVAVVILHVYKT